jgi:hypothetical protein
VGNELRALRRLQREQNPKSPTESWQRFTGRMGVA